MVDLNNSGAKFMREAYEKGYLGRKLQDQGATLKLTPEMHERLDIEVKALGIDKADLVREIIARYLVEEDYLFENKCKARGITSNPSDSFGTQQKSPSAVTDEPNGH